MNVNDALAAMNKIHFSDRDREAIRKALAAGAKTGSPEAAKALAEIRYFDARMAGKPHEAAVSGVKEELASILPNLP